MIDSPFYYGIIEDRNDPQKLNRVRVRIFGVHPERKTYIGTPDLPWAQVLMPVTSATLSGFGGQHGLVEGSHVTVIFRDPDTKQDPVVIGTVAGINLPKKVDNVIDRTVEKGFNDPRRLKVKDYEGTVDGVAPLEANAPRDGLLASIETSPVIPESLQINFENTGSNAEDGGVFSRLQSAVSDAISDAVSYITGGDDGEEREGSGGSKIINPKITADDLPYYPKSEYYNLSDISKFAKGEFDYSGLLDGGPLPKTNAKPVYPYNKSWLTESGHLIEYDDTRDKERILVYHRSGTYTEIQPMGDRHTRVVQSDYEVVCGKKEVTVCGDVKIVVKGNAQIDISGSTDITSGGNLSIIAPNIRLN